MIIETLTTFVQLSADAAGHIAHSIVAALNPGTTHATNLNSAQDILALAPTPDPGPTPLPTKNLDTTGVLGFISSKVAPILLAALGVIFISRAGKGEMSKVLTSSAIAIVGLAFIAGAGLLFAFGNTLVNLIIK